MMVLILLSVTTEGESTAQEIPIGPRHIVARAVSPLPALLGQMCVNIRHGLSVSRLLRLEFSVVVSS